MPPRKSKPKPNDKEQSNRFIEKAKKIHSENAQEAFETAINKIIKKKRGINTKKH
jgi:hypothetical protein